MKFNLKSNILKLLILGAGAAGFLLRKILYSTGIDGRGLIVSNHWSLILLLCLTGAAAAVVLLSCLHLKGPDVYKDCYPVSFAGFIGCLAAAAGVAYTVWPEFGQFLTVLDILIWVIGIAAAVSFAAIGICRLTRRKPYFLLHAAICLYLALRLVTRYRLWSSDPQVLDYCFYMTAYVSLMLTAYHHAAFDADMGKHRGLWLCSLAGVYLSCVSLVTRQDAALLAGCALWAFTNLTNLNSRKRRLRPSMQADAGEEAKEESP